MGALHYCRGCHTVARCICLYYTQPNKARTVNTEVNMKLKYYSFVSKAGVSSLTFAEVSRRIHAWSRALEGGGVFPTYAEGSPEHLGAYTSLLALVTSRWEATGNRLLCDLNHQLAPFMGDMVMVRDESGWRKVRVMITYGVVPQVVEVIGAQQFAVHPEKLYMEVRECTKK